MLGKHLSLPRIGFKVENLSFSVQLIINGVVTLIGITYWAFNED
jgi:hypothetical protein